MSLGNSRKNILVIMSDQHNFEKTGAYGNEVVRTPTIDRLASEGLRFTGAYTPSPICVPARMSFITGRRPCENNVVDNFDILSSCIPTWPERLTEAGYHTALIGRMHFEGPDQFHGFETTCPELRHWRDTTPVKNQEESPYVPTCSYWSPRESIIDLSGSGRTFVQYRDELVTSRGCEFLRSEAAGGTRPFAAVIGLYNPHPPYVGRPDLFNYYYDKIEVPEETLALMPPYLTEYYGTYRNWEDPEVIDSESKRRALAAYYANCEHMDEQLGLILKTLDETGLSENTLVIYTSDHGDMTGVKGAWGKGSLFEQSARVPMIASLPGEIEAGTNSSHVCNLRSLGNTFCDIAGAEPLEASDAPSLLPVLEGRGDEVPNETESELFQGSGCFGGDDDAYFKMYRQEEWKFWCYHIGERKYFSLFNLKEDPEELHDLIDEPAYTDRVKRMKETLLSNWESGRLMEEADRRQQDRVILNKSWHKKWLHAVIRYPKIWTGM